MLYFIIILAVLLVLVLVVMIVDDHRFRTEHYDIASEKIDRPVTLVLLADLHGHVYGKNNEKLLAAIEAENPDGILIAGDMVTATKGEDGDSALKLLHALSGRCPIYYAPGNHEQRLKRYTKVFGDSWEMYKAALDTLQLSYLSNAKEELPDTSVSVYGLALPASLYRRGKVRPFSGEKINPRLGEPDAERFNLLIAHNPDYFPAYAEWGADLVVSGHVHGGVVRLPFVGGLLSPRVRFFPRYDSGCFTEGKSRMIVSRGLGTHWLSIRFLNPGELAVIRLHGTEQETKE